MHEKRRRMVNTAAFLYKRIVAAAGLVRALAAGHINLLTARPKRTTNEPKRRGSVSATL